MRTVIMLTGLIAVLTMGGPAIADPLLAPGLYQIEVRISLPNVQDVATPLLFDKCITPTDLESGQVFFVLSDNPLKKCDLLDYEAASGRAIYSIACAGPNRGSAVAVFETRETSYRGTIKMNMGGKNMTMFETQTGKRIGDCQ